MKRYETYKDSGIEWLGEIPEHWKVVPLKFNLSLKARVGWKGLKSDEFEKDSYAYLVTGQDFNGEEINWSNCYQIGKERYEEDSYIQLKNGDLLITKDGTIGKVAKVKNLSKPACLNSGIFVVRQINNNYIQDFLYWLFMSNLLSEYNKSLSTGSTIQHLYQNVFENMPLQVLPISEQERIVSYLDNTIGLVESLISAKERQVEDLQQYRSSIISEAVTRGIHPDVEFKDSGVEWLERIPQHWNVFKTLYVLAMPITDGPHTTPEFYDKGIPFISAEAISGGTIDFSKMRGYISDSFYQECCLKYIPQKNDIYMIKSGATTGRTAIVETDRVFTIWSPLAVFRADKNKILPRFLLYTLRSDSYQEQVELNWSYGTQQNIGMRTLEQLKLCVPPIPEQQEIVDYLDAKTSKIDETIQELKTQIEDLRQYKKSVISEAVTGKVDLRDWKPK